VDESYDALISLAILVWVALAAVSVLVSNRAQLGLITALREKFPEIWRSLGSPIPIAHFSAAELYGATAWWVLRAAYKRTQDAQVIRYGSQLRFALVIQLLLAFTILAVVFAA